MQFNNHRYLLMLYNLYILTHDGGNCGSLYTACELFKCVSVKPETNYYVSGQLKFLF